MGSRLEKNHRECRCCGCIHQDSSNERKTKIKISLFGPCEVGKNALTNRIVDNTFIEGYTKTMNCERPEIKRKVDEEEITITIVNPAGDERFISLNRIFYKLSDAFLMIFALDDKKSFEELKQRYIYEKENLLSKTYVIGNKKDRLQYLEVSEEEAKEFANEINAKYFSISCLTNEGINEMMEKIIEDIVNNYN